MAKLILSFEGKPVKEINLSAQRTLIGRRSSNQIQLDHLAVSGVHAALECIGEDYFIEDQHSKNGTALNGKKIKRSRLNNADEIKIAKYRLQFIQDHAAQSVNEFESTMPMNLHEAPRNALIRVLTGLHAGREFLIDKECCTLSKAGVQVAKILRREEGFFLAHVQGKERPRVNGLLLNALEQQLNEADLIEILDIRMAFFFR
ncbi:FHA domain-containing protein [Deefgea salmonis]|uniref:FHA domain-containing protein n=1 Tax=Deefgea salmonis TaxID=2875502 RepID=A0ABS8BK13_9NEIS|nr:FHA domain-containing protein [Deefgea salmonis]MCB5196055.1 FHA domain-containing protein [Deefgea salmonis]